jgi:hypothetical protein
VNQLNRQLGHVGEQIFRFVRAAGFEEVGHHERRVVVYARGDLESTACRRYGTRAQPGISADIFELLEKETVAPFSTAASAATRPQAPAPTITTSTDTSSDI